MPPKAEINENTKVPLQMVFALIVAYGGALLWIAAIGAKADQALATSNESVRQIETVQKDVSDVKAGNARIEGMIKVLLEKR